MKPSLAAVSSSIIRNSMPTITPDQKAYIDWAKATEGAVNGFYDVKDRQNTQEAWQREKDEQDRYNAFRQEYGDAVAKGDIPASLAVLAKSDPFKHIQITTELENIDKQNKLKQVQLMLEKQALEERMRERPTKEMQNYEFFANKFGEDKAAQMLGLGAESNKNASSNIFERKRIENIAKNTDENIKTAEEQIAAYQKLKDLLAGIETGGIPGLIKSKMNDSFLSAKESEFQSIVNQIIPKMRPVGSGVASDKDMEMFKAATVGLNKPKETNLNIINANLLANENAKAREELRADWISSGGSLSDFDKEWRNYVNNNPIFNSDGDYSLNTNRIDPYAYFAGERTQNSNSQSGTSEKKDNDPLGIR